MNVPHEPFDADEARLARVYRALPQVEPAPALDARILANARAAVARTPRAKQRPWFLGAGLGTAAAAVFAAGIAWQLGIFEPERALESLPAQVPAVQEELERIDIEFMKEEKRDAPPAPPAKPQVTGGVADAKKLREQPQAFPAQAPPPPAPVARREQAPSAQENAATPMDAAPVMQGILPAPEPMPTERAEHDDGPAAASSTVSAPMQDARTPSSAVDRVYSMSPEAAPAEPTAGAEAKSEPGHMQALERAPAQSQPRLKQPVSTSGATRAPAGRASSRTADGARNRGNARHDTQAAPYSDDFARDVDGAGSDAEERSLHQAGLPPWAEDAALAPDAWLERIRDRVQAGDRQGAEHSLRRFVLAHPAQRVPRDLQRLLAE